MNTVEVPDWETFEREVKKLREEYQDSYHALVFRGQGDSDWELKTTLERNRCEHMLFRDYYMLISSSLGPEVKTFAGVDVPTYDRENCVPFMKPGLLYEIGDVFPIEIYRYMAYLRHFGFPSPFLDWSRSPFVAAFFAFRDDPLRNPKKRSIFAYCSKPIGLSGGTLGQPIIRQLGPYVQTHKRHFQQRCDYTICGNYDENYGWRYDSHQAVFDEANPRQDFLWKFELPSTERKKVLGVLSDYNFNAYSLFGSEESLLETMWIQEQVLGRKSTGTIA